MSVPDPTQSTAVVTGASRGFGRAIAAALVAAGTNVLGVARDERALQAPLAARPAQHDERQVVRRDDRARGELHDVRDEPLPRDVVDASPDRLEGAQSSAGGGRSPLRARATRVSIRAPKPAMTRPQTRSMLRPAAIGAATAP